MLEPDFSTQILALPFTGCVIFGKSLNLSVLFLPLKMELIRFSYGYCKD